MALFETMALASSSILASEAPSAKAKHAQLSQQPRGQASHSRIQSPNHGFEKGLCVSPETIVWDTMLTIPFSICNQFIFEGLF